MKKCEFNITNKIKSYENIIKKNEKEFVVKLYSYERK
mgnify:CR=1 FL=1